ncbi:MAG: uroporphyrinogen decarboxylase family protein [Planctomycetota bacterium]
MNSQDRVMAAVTGKIPDRVPVMEMFIDARVIDSICPGMCYEDFIDYADMDVVTCLTMADKLENINWVNKEKKIWRDKWGALQQTTGETISIVVPPAAVNSEEDLDNYIPPDPGKAFVLDHAKKLVDRFKGKKAIAVVGEASFAPVVNMRAGFENMFIDYATRPELIHKLAKIAIDYHIELYRKLLAEGVEIIVLGDDYAGKNGPFMSPRHFAEYVLPGLKTVVKEVKSKGGYIIKHCDGNFWTIIDMLISTGIDMLGPLEPAYMALDKVRRYSGGKVGVVGNIDVDLLSVGSVEEVKAATKELLSRVSPLGGHILSSGNTISSSVKGENFMVMLETARQFGKYPISIN